MALLTRAGPPVLDWCRRGHPDRIFHLEIIQSIASPHEQALTGLFAAHLTLVSRLRNLLRFS